jgi:hypothetical protein
MNIRLLSFSIEKHLRQAIRRLYHDPRPFSHGVMSAVNKVMIAHTTDYAVCVEVADMSDFLDEGSYWKPL